MNRNNKSGQAGLIAFGIILVMLAIVWGVIGIISSVRAGYTFERDYLSQWTLADKSSTIAAKSQYITAFVGNLESNKNNFASHNAIFLQTPDNSFDKNVQALITLRDRLKDIEKMDPKSFEYNQAIQQVTAQEQGEAHSLISVIQGCYYLENYKMVWEWIAVVSWISIIILAIFGAVLISVGNENMTYHRNRW